MSTSYKLKKDGYSKSRGGTSAVLKLSCSNCGKCIADYQKDGAGALLRTYIDRFLGPVSFIEKLTGLGNKSDMKSLVCSSCKNILGTPMVYKKEKRLAYRIKKGAVATSKL